MPTERSANFLTLSSLPIFLLIFGSFSSDHSVLVEGATTANKSRCYSCASENMKENFLTRDRGPRGRVAEPKLFDSMCDLDTWMIREKSAEECDGVCQMAADSQQQRSSLLRHYSWMLPEDVRRHGQKLHQSVHHVRRALP